MSKILSIISIIVMAIVVVIVYMAIIRKKASTGVSGFMDSFTGEFADASVYRSMYPGSFSESGKIISGSPAAIMGATEARALGDEFYQKWLLVGV